MSGKRKLTNLDQSMRQKRSKASYQAMLKGEHYLSEGRYGKALARFFKYEECEPKAMFYLGMMYFDGLGVIENLEKGIDYIMELLAFPVLRDGEEHLVTMAYYYLGDLHYRGLGLEKDNDQALKYWHQAATNKSSKLETADYGVMKAQVSLAMFYSNPEFQDLAKSLYWHKKAFEGGSIVSEGALGVMYLYGMGVSENHDEAYKYLVNAAVKGYAYAKGYLAVFYYLRQMYHRTVVIGNELVQEKDFKESARKVDCPVEHVVQGVALGSFYLALCYQYGYDVRKDLALAKSLIKWALELSPTLTVDLHIKAIHCIP